MEKTSTSTSPIKHLRSLFVVYAFSVSPTERLDTDEPRRVDIFEYFINQNAAVKFADKIAEVFDKKGQKVILKQDWPYEDFPVVYYLGRHLENLMV